MQIFTSDVIEQKFINSDNSEFSAKTTILTQNEIEKLENPDFYSQASQNSCEVFILPIKSGPYISAGEITRTSGLVK